MKKEDLKRLCLGAATAKSPARFAASILPELGITIDQVEETEISETPRSDLCTLGAKMIKISCTRLRKDLWEYLLEKKLIEIGKELPRVGRWEAGFILVDVGESHMFTTRMIGAERNNHKNPLENLEFLKMVFLG
jgi:hypothetical protein